MPGKKHTGSSFDDFLQEEGIYAEATVDALKRVLSWQVANAMKEKGITKVEMARRMRTSRAALDRLLDPDNFSVTLKTIFRASRVLDKKIRLEFSDTE